MEQPNRPPKTAVPNTYSWQLPQNPSNPATQGWSYVPPTFPPPPVGFPNSWNTIPPPSQTYPSPQINPVSMTQRNTLQATWPFPNQPSTQNSGAVIPPNIPFCPPPSVVASTASPRFPPPLPPSVAMSNRLPFIPPLPAMQTAPVAQFSVPPPVLPSQIPPPAPLPGILPSTYPPLVTPGILNVNSYTTIPTVPTSYSSITSDTSYSTTSNANDSALLDTRGKLNNQESTSKERPNQHYSQTKNYNNQMKNSDEYGSKNRRKEDSKKEIKSDDSYISSRWSGRFDYGENNQRSRAENSQNRNNSNNFDYNSSKNYSVRSHPHHLRTPPSRMERDYYHKKSNENRDDRSPNCTKSDMSGSPSRSRTYRSSRSPSRSRIYRRSRSSSRSRHSRSPSVSSRERKCDSYSDTRNRFNRESSRRSRSPMNHIKNNKSFVSFTSNSPTCSRDNTINKDNQGLNCAILSSKDSPVKMEEAHEAKGNENAPSIIDPLNSFSFSEGKKNTLDADLNIAKNHIEHLDGNNSFIENSCVSESISTRCESKESEHKNSPRNYPIRDHSDDSKSILVKHKIPVLGSEVRNISRSGIRNFKTNQWSRNARGRPLFRHGNYRQNRYHNPESSGSRDRDIVNRRSREISDETFEDQPALSTEASKWISSTPAENFYQMIDEESKEVMGTEALKELHLCFQNELVERAERARALKPKYNPPMRKTKLRKHKPPATSGNDSSSSSKESSSDEEDTALEELERKRQHPDRLHPELWFNDPKEMNDGPLCRCSAKARRSGIRHGIYVSEEHLPPCNPWTNNAKRLHHYKIAMTPVTNFLTKSPTSIVHEGQKYIFEGFSMFSHKPLPKLPNCKVIRFNYEYTIVYVEEEMPHNFTIAGLELFSKFLLHEILELVDLDWKAHNDPDGCPQFHFMPRFAKVSKDDGKELLSLNVVLEYLLKANEILIDENKLAEIMAYSTKKWQDLADEVKGMIVTCPGMKPSSIRVDQLDREHIDSKHDTTLPVIVHFGVRPPQLSYAGNPLYQKAWRDYVKYRHLLANKPKVRYVDRHKLNQKESKLQDMRMENDLKRDVTVVISSKDFYKTGIMSDVVQHAMLLPVLVCHLRFHASLSNLEEKINYNFTDRFLLQLALTHPSYRENFGTNPDHARNSLTNCGLRQPEYGDRKIHYLNTRKRGINTLINIMSRLGCEEEATSSINHNERLEFLGDAVVEFLSSIHLFYMFPDLEEGGLATYRAAIVQNQHLAILSKKLHLEKFMLYAHGSDLCHDLELRHAMANCFEALMGALFLDDGIEAADKVFSVTLFPEPELQEVWKNYPLHPLQEQEPGGDRQWIDSVPLLKKLTGFEDSIGIEFTHIRLLARALTHRSLGYNNLTLGSNQRLEFLGDTVLQLVASEYLYKYFPQHHEGHLSLLRSSLVNNRTQAVVCGDLGMVAYAIYPYFKVELKPKDKADLLEAFLGALYVDKDLGYCRKFCEVCFFPRLQDFIMNQDWNDPKSKLQQCCLTLRSMDGGEPDIPTYKVIECKGPTNTRVYSVAVYFKTKRLAVGTGHSIQQAEMDAAANALLLSKDHFPQLKHQKRALQRNIKTDLSKPNYSKYQQQY